MQEAREPRNVSELKSYLGLLTYYSRFLPNMATALNPLYNLLRKAVPWRWTARERHLKTLNSFLCRLKCWCILTQSSSWCWHVTHLRMVLGRYCHTACLMEQRSRSRLLLGRSPNLSETSPEDREISEQRLEETPARQTEQTERCYPKRVHRPPERYSDTL